MSTLALVLLSFSMLFAGMGWTATQSGSGPARMDKDVRIQYYDIQGTSWQELAQQMRAKGPGDFFGQTLYQIGYRYTSQRMGDRCWVAEATVTLDVTVTLPRWQRRSAAERAAPYELRRDWDLFRTRLERHEQQHVRIAERGAEAVRRFLDDVQGECTTMDEVVNQRVRTIVAEWDETNRHYDVRTGHGRTEGAVWPVSADVARR
ncbi:MAG: DUF922 domain-containing protein [Bacteroidota bacterium]